MSEDLMPTVIAVLIVIFMMFIKDRYGGTKTFDNEVERWVSRAVNAAEQMFPGE